MWDKLDPVNDRKVTATVFYIEYGNLYWEPVQFM